MKYRYLFLLGCVLATLQGWADTYTLSVTATDCSKPTQYTDLVYGEQVEIEAVPNRFYRFVQWNDGNTENPRTITVTGDATYSASFEYNCVSLSVYAEGCDKPCMYTQLEKGEQIEIEAIPQQCYRFVQWNDGSTENPRVVTVNEDKSYTASFAYDCYTLTVYAKDCATPNVVHDIASGAQVKVTAQASGEDKFKQWNDGNTDNPRYVTVTSDTTLTALFEYDHYKYDRLTLTFYSEGEDGCDEHKSIYKDMSYDDQITVTPQPMANHHFVQWNDGNTDNPRVITVAGNDTYVATFAPDMHELTWDFVGGATSSAEDAYSHGQVMYNTPITPPADPTKDGYTFTGWSPEVSALMPDEDVTYTATWALDQLELYDAAQGAQTLEEAQSAMQATLNAWAGKTTDVIIHRTLWRDGYYNTLCLPFDLESLEGTPLEGGQLMEYTGADVYATTLDVHIQPASSITAYKPYLISFDLDENITSMTFTDVTIESYKEVGVQAGEGVNFLATITPTKLSNGDKSLLFVAAENTLNWPSENDQSTMKGFRAYFKVNDTPTALVIRRGMPAQLVVGSRQTPTGLESLSGLSREGVRKVLHDNRILIIRNGVVYDAIGNKQVK